MMFINENRKDYKTTTMEEDQSLCYADYSDRQLYPYTLDLESMVYYIYITFFINSYSFTREQYSLIIR